MELGFSYNMTLPRLIRRVNCIDWCIAALRTGEYVFGVG